MFLHLLQQVVTSTMLLVTKVLHLTMQVCSIAHTFLYRWFVQWERTPSSQKSGLRLVMVWLLTHLLKDLHKDLVLLQLTLTVTTEELLLQTLCKSYYILFKRLLRGSFFCQEFLTINIVTGGKDNVTFQMGNTRSPRIRSRNS